MAGTSPPHPPSVLASPWSALPPLVRDLVTAAVLLAGSVVPQLITVLRTAPWLIVLSATVAVGVVLFRRRFDLITFAVAGATLVLTTVVDHTYPGAILPAAVALYAVTSRRGRPVGLICLISAVVAILLAYLLSPPATWGGPGDGPNPLTGPALLTAAAALGETHRARRAYIKEITERAERAEATRESEAQRRVAEDRLRIARDLHDVVAHQIAVINLQAGVASSALPDRPEAAESSLRVVRESARSVLQDIGSLLAMLRDESDGRAGPVTEPVASLSRLEELVEGFRRAGLRVDLTGPAAPGTVPPAVDLVSYRVIHEVLTNAHKHGTGEVGLTVRRDPYALMITADNPARAGSDRTGGEGWGHGLQGIRERVGSVRGTAEVSRADGRFLITIRIPLTPDPAVRVAGSGQAP
ncbi:sensor histidine kinase [Microlunatus sp. GCM10028923]|uniref:sensor histidine kinase n=1 Tax=Microlunatus sp. GCM10028923 TaxID=3273400 RepID=UPI003615DFAA